MAEFVQFRSVDGRRCFLNVDNIVRVYDNNDFLSVCVRGDDEHIHIAGDDCDSVLAVLASKTLNQPPHPDARVFE